ncbi:MAG: hypothetical protein IPP74_03060 [Alphaproteobacteria bacterium]|nr:hypothetical protein [Alphaproteobacteria bacterium]
MIQDMSDHKHFDVAPYYKFGNASNDKTTQAQREYQFWKFIPALTRIK